MKKEMLVVTLAISTIGSIANAGVTTTEKDIGACTARNARGYCIQSNILVLMLILSLDNAVVGQLRMVTNLKI